MDRDRRARGSARARALAALTALAAPHAATAAFAASMVEPPAEAAAAESRAPLDLYLNGGRRGAVPVVLRDGDALVAVEHLEAAGLRGFTGRREVVDGRVHVSLASLEPGLRYEVDERALALRVTAQAELLGRSAVDLRSTRRPPGLEARGDASGFLNYSIQLRTDRRPSAFAEAGASEGGRLLYSSGQLLADGTAVRGLSSLTVDDPRALRRLVVGDAFAASSGLGGGVLLGGVSLAREYGLDPYLIRSPAPRLSGFASTPSVLDVYVNGVLRREVELPPGGYDLSNLPVTAGAGDVRTVLRDVFGRTEVLSWPYYYSAGLLGRGLSDYGYAAGFRRLQFGRTSFDYGSAAFLGHHRFGVSDALTLGGRLDAAPELLSGGPSATLGLPFGTLDLEAAASVHAGTLGAAASANYSFVSRRFGAGALVRYLSDGYAHGTLRAADDRARVQASLFAGAPVGARINLGLNYSLVDRRDAGSSDVLSARADLLLARNLTLGVTGSRTGSRGGAAVHDVFATLSWAFAPMSVMDVSAQTDGSVSAGAQRGLPAGTGFGYRGRAGSGPAAESATALVQYQWDRGRYEAQYDRVGAIETGTATIAGGAVRVGDRFFLSGPVQDGYGLIRVGVPGIRGFAEGQEIGRTDARGDLLVPSLVPYYGNRLAIADRDVPIEYRIGETELTAAPTLRGGVVTRFAVTPLRVVEGELVTFAEGADGPPAYGELSLHASGEAFSSPVGGDGRFYLEALKAGAHAAEVEWSGGRCRVTLRVPESPSFVDLGRIRCEPDLAQPVLVRAEPPAPDAAPSPAKAKATAERDGGPPAKATAERDGGAPAKGATERDGGPPAKGAAERDGGPVARVPHSAGKTAAATSATRRASAVAVAEPAAKAAPVPAALVPAAADPPVPPRRAGPGPRRRGCPSCAVCVSAALDRISGAPKMSCIPAPAAYGPAVSPSEAAKACLADVDEDELCAACMRVRRWRRCPSGTDLSSPKTPRRRPLAE